MSKQRPLSGRLGFGRQRCLVRLGWEESERKSTQWVSFDVEIRFQGVPPACLSDELKETICYDAISAKIREVCAHRAYRLVESLGYDAFQAVRQLLPESAALRVRVTKEAPPIPDLQGGATFSIEEEPGEERW